MSLEWIHDNPPHWDDDKASIIGGAPAGAISLGTFGSGDLLPGEWWRVEDGASVVGYGWMDCNWGDAEILLVVDAAGQKKGVGTFILDHLEREAASRGLNYMYNVVPENHPNHDAVSAWLTKRGFEPSHDSDRLMRRIKPAS